MQRLPALICLTLAACMPAPARLQTVFGRNTGLLDTVPRAEAAADQARPAIGQPVRQEPLAGEAGSSAGEAPLASADGAARSGAPVAGGASGDAAEAAAGAAAASTATGAESEGATGRSGTGPDAAADRDHAAHREQHGAAANGAAVNGQGRVAPTADDAPIREHEHAALLEELHALEAALRAELAEAADPRDPALRLAQLLDGEERLPEARVVLQDALARRPDDPVLRVALAGMLRDLGEPALAAAELEQVLTALGPAAAAPTLLFDLAVLQSIAGDRTRSSAVLALLEEHHAQDPWVQQNRRAIDEFARGVRQGEPPRLMLPDLLGRLRTDPSPTIRLRMLDVLLGASPGAAARAVEVAVRDVDPLLRASAVARAQVQTANLAEFCAVAMVDPDPLVRQAGARRARELEAEAAASILLPAIAREEDPDTFTVMHQTLSKDRQGPRLEFGDAADPARRAALVEAWRSRWQ